ncbi:Zinc-finger homeodomain protein 5 [Hibiscus syriacus]|uniref:Zinc-finger homeodomain protein 5 n=1 Tax=Hibiscus syriacus TaxID=106335 RepID=A0A6A3CIU8_HIBSY|nr:zinc-finger homeodomain protein 5-like [Hibiscus syriacus]KAE8728434.1 Zinc-finger homeodomain protein 5 [Hibiscus syriacus]
MEVRGQEHEFKPTGSSPFGHQRDGNHNGTAALTCTQTLDHVHRIQRQQSIVQGRSPHSDPVATATSAAVAPISVSSNTKPSSLIRYRECLKNHAANIGGNVYDGCGEFMPSGEEGTLEALKCAACDCHRNFHRKEVDGETQFWATPTRSLMLHPLQLPPPTVMHPHQNYSIHTSPSSALVASMNNMAFGSGGGGNESSSEDLHVFQSNAEGTQPPPSCVLSKKRFRTKFTQEQKDKMLELAEKVGWRINKQDEELVQNFCAEYGVKRQVFKVWMHNNKNVKKQPPE